MVHTNNINVNFNEIENKKFGFYSLGYMHFDQCSNTSCCIGSEDCINDICEEYYEWICWSYLHTLYSMEAWYKVIDIKLRKEDKRVIVQKSIWLDWFGLYHLSGYSGPFQLGVLLKWYLFLTMSLHLHRVRWWPIVFTPS